MKTDRPELDAYYAAFETEEMREIARATLETNNETPRGKVLVNSSLIEIRLESLLRAALNDSASTDKLFQATTGPLGTFNSKLLLARSMGLIDDDELSELNIVRRIRNKFAHELFCSFDDQPINDQTFALKLGMDNLDKNSLSASVWFGLSCAHLAMRIYHKWETLVRTTAS